MTVTCEKINVERVESTIENKSEQKKKKKLSPCSTHKDYRYIRAVNASTHAQTHTHTFH